MATTDVGTPWHERQDSQGVAAIWSAVCLSAPAGADRRRYLIDRLTRLGRAPANPGLALADTRLSRNHCSLHPVGIRLDVADLGSSNGSWLMGRRVTNVSAEHNQVLRIGDTVLVLECDGGAHTGHRTATADVPGLSERARVVRAELELAARTRLPVLIQGETGTGKERAADAVHAATARFEPRRAGGPLVRLNVAAVPEGLFESELFGHVKGAFSGALAARPGRLVEADGGTLVLDEIGELPLPQQAKLLRTLEDGQVRAVGGSRDRRVDVRFVATTNADLGALVASGQFRQDLAARLQGATVQLPPLRNRRADLLLLANAVHPTKPGWASRLSADAVEVLALYDWPNNLRELRSALAWTDTLVSGNDADIEHLPAGILAAVTAKIRSQSSPSHEPTVVSKASSATDGGTNRSEAQEAAAQPSRRRPDAAALREALERHAGNCGAIAREMGVHRRQVYRWLTYAGIEQSELDAMRK